MLIDVLSVLHGCKSVESNSSRNEELLTLLIDLDIFLAYGKILQTRDTVVDIRSFIYHNVPQYCLVGFGHRT